MTNYPAFCTIRIILLLYILVIFAEALAQSSQSMLWIFRILHFAYSFHILHLAQDLLILLDQIFNFIFGLSCFPSRFHFSVTTFLGHPMLCFLLRYHLHYLGYISDFHYVISGNPSLLQINDLNILLGHYPQLYIYF